MRTIDVNFVGGENQSRSKFWSSQSSVNLYVDSQRTGSTASCLMPWPGEKMFSSGSDQPSRGFTLHDGNPYLIEGDRLIKIDSFGAREDLGYINGSGRCSFATDGVNLIIRTGSKTYIYNGSLFEVTDTDIENGQTAAYINSQVIYQGVGQRFGVADAGDPFNVDGLNYASAESYPDDIVQIVAFNERLYIGGTQSLEVWYNSLDGTPPFTRIGQSTTQVGVASPFSMATSDEYLYFLGSDSVAYRVSAYQPESVTPSAIAKELRESDKSDSQGYTVQIDGQYFYILQFPTSNKTLAYSEATGEWIRLSTGLGKDIPRHLINGYVYAFGKHLISDYRNGNIFEWDFDTYTSNGDEIVRQRDSAPINGIQLGVPGSRLLMSKAEFMFETGVGTSDSVDPSVMVSCSTNGGRSFTNETWINLGRSGENVLRVEWYKMISFYEIVLRIRVSDPNFVGIRGSSMSIKESGW